MPMLFVATYMPPTVMTDTDTSLHYHNHLYEYNPYCISRQYGTGQEQQQVFTKGAAIAET